jgi:L-lactate dehydrogenase complex protein LldG
MTTTRPLPVLAEEPVALVPLLAERIREYKAWVGEVSQTQLRATIASRIQARQAQHIVVPADISPDWLPEGPVFCPDYQLSANEIALSDGVLTGARVAIASTGTIVLDGGVGQGRRMLSLLPDYHLCVVFQAQIVADVPDAFADLQPQGGAQPFLTLISGPSATSDIELNRVEGVHGPRTLDVIIVRTE